MIAYNCKYTPIELLSVFDDCVLLNNSASDFETAERLLHPNMCSHVKAMLEEILNGSFEQVFFMNCCTSTLKLADVLDREFSKEKTRTVHLVDLPADTGGCAVEKLARDLLALVKKLEDHYQKPFDKKAFLNAFTDKPLQFPKIPYILLLGARSHPSLLNAVRTCFEQPVIDMTCANNGRVLRCDLTEEDPLEDLMKKYAKALLSQIPCMRMSDVQARKQLLNDDNCVGILYHTIKFCDYYNFEYAALAKEQIPLLKIETDHTSLAEGQILTRLEGFRETIASASEPPVKKERKGDVSMKTLYAGIDSGSTSTEVVILDENKKILKTVMVRTGATAQQGAEKALKESGYAKDQFRRIVATGYGRKHIDFADAQVTEITCHARGAKHLFPDVKMIIDIGGQDSKVITLDDEGKVSGFVMNDKCAAGTGRFLENMAKVLDMDLSEMAARGLSYKKDLSISSMCTVFAESEVVSLIAENQDVADIIHGLNKSVASKTRILAHNAPKEGILMTGGVANNRGVVKELEKQFGTTIHVPEHPEFCGALGACLIAIEQES